MAININGAPPQPVRGTGQTGCLTSSKVEQLPGAVMPEQPLAGPDKLQLTPESLQLRKMEAALSNEPVFNQERVEALRKAISSGEYRVNSARVAGKLLAFEAELFK